MVTRLADARGAMERGLVPRPVLTRVPWPELTVATMGSTNGSAGSSVATAAFTGESAGESAGEQPGPNRSLPRLEVVDLDFQTADGATLLDGLNFKVLPGELVAIVGASGCGKSTLLNTLAGNLRPTAGQVVVDGLDATKLDDETRRRTAFVPQDDVLGDDLPLKRMLIHAARLRVGRRTSTPTTALVEEALDQVGLTDSGATKVRNLSGGERRRASIAMELVGGPELCLLDEPTSGLDPAMADSVVSHLRRLADRGRAVVFVTHNANDLRQCDRIVALGSRGRMAFNGSVGEAMEATGSTSTDEVHRALISRSPTVKQATVNQPRTSEQGDLVSADVRPVKPAGAKGRRPSQIGQWWTLTVRTLETVARNRMTSAIMIGSPAMVIAMFAVLFRPGAFDPASPSPTSAIMIAFWVSFGAFFFGLTYGLLQITPEVPMMARERRAGVAPYLQVLAKLAALTPILVAINIAMLAVLGQLDRLPTIAADSYGSLAVTLALDATAALALGLAASALVRNTLQAALALPLLCFPAVLFSGAVLPVAVMAPAGRAISAAMSDRWAFELVGRDLGLRPLFAYDTSPLGPSLLREFGDAWTIEHGTGWLLLAVWTVALSLVAWWALARRCRTAA